MENFTLKDQNGKHGEMAKKFGVFDEEMGFSKRVNIVIGRDRNVELIKIYKISELPDINEIIEFMGGK